MPIYEHICVTCREAKRPAVVVSLVRPMSQSDDTPQGGCPVCGGVAWARQWTAPMLLIPGGGSERSVYPLALTALRERDRDGNPIVVKNRAEYDAVLEARGLLCMAEGYDPMVGDSQRSVWDRRETPAPSDYAKRLSEQVRFVTESELSAHGLAVSVA